MHARNRDEWMVERWRDEPAPPLWKDLAVASIAAVLLWGAAVVMFG